MLNNQVIKSHVQRWQTYFLIGVPLFLTAVTFLIYFPSLWYDFMFDDLPTITNYIHNRYIDFQGLLFGNPRWISRLLNQITNYYWGTNVLAYRIFNLALHLGIGLMTFFLVLRLLENLKKNDFLKNHSFVLATLTMMLMLLHPAQTQTVPYITQMRLEGLVTFFCVAIALAFAYAATTKNSTTQRILYGLSFVLMLFAAGTKEIIVVLPPLLVLVDWFFISECDWQSFKSRWWVHLLYWVILYGMMLKYGIVTPHYVKSITSPVHNNRGNILTSSAQENITMYPFLLSQGKVLLHYLWIFLWPFGITFDYGVTLSQNMYALDVIVPYSMLLLLLFVCLRWYFAQMHTMAVFGFAWFFIAMLPRTSVFLTTELICDYKTYPASLGIMMVLAYGIVQLSLVVSTYVAGLMDQKNRLVYGCWAGTALCLMLSVTTGIRKTVWRSELDFWGDCIAYTPKARGLNNYAIALWERGKTDEAISHFRQAIEKDDWYAEPHINMATIYQMRGEKDKAFEHYKRALEIGEAHPELFNNLGMLHFEEQNWQAAELCLKQAVDLQPYNAKAQFNLGKVYHVTNRIQEAFDCYENALKWECHEPDFYYLHGQASFELGQIDRVISSLEKVDKNFQDVAYMLGCAYYSKPNYQKSAELLELAHAKDPANKICTYNYAQALLNLRRYQEALNLYDLLKNDYQSFPYAVLHRAKCLAELGKKDEAQKSIKLLLAKAPSKEIVDDAKALAQEFHLG